jgi:hypothetical protein
MWVRKAISAELERHGFRCAHCLNSTPRPTFRHVAASLPHQPLPFAVDMQSERSQEPSAAPFDWKAVVFALVNH